MTLALGDFKAPNSDGFFGAVRKHDIHTGIDLYCKAGESVYAIEDGEIVNIEDFTGEKAGSPWWENTKAILIEIYCGVICYGEVEPNANIYIGKKVKKGEKIGVVKTVLKKDKGQPMTMLHFELYKLGTRNTVWWHLGQPQPQELLDPTCMLVGMVYYVKDLYYKFYNEGGIIKIVRNTEMVCSKCGITTCHCIYTKQPGLGTYAVSKSYYSIDEKSILTNAMKKLGIKINEKELERLKKATEK